ncbi:tumor necrosis factor receptor superfamily member 11B-like [Menidia menidia]
MVSLAVLVLLSAVLRGATAEDSVPTYQRVDPVTGQTLTCEKCPPGYHMDAHCTATSATKCSPCRSGHYTELWNYLPRCLYCSNFCSHNQEVERECSPINNSVCRCKQGFYWVDDFCTRHSPCGPGHGVQTTGTSQSDTVCEKCPKGYFSSSSSATDPCVKHHQCANGEVLLLPGSAYEDNVCGSSEDIDEGQRLRVVLSAFFNSPRNRVRQLRRFVSRIIRKTGHECCTTVPKERGPLLDQIRAWLSQAPAEHLRQLPKKLRDSHLTSMADKVDEILRRD